MYAFSGMDLEIPSSNQLGGVLRRETVREQGGEEREANRRKEAAEGSFHAEKLPKPENKRKTSGTRVEI